MAGKPSRLDDQVGQPGEVHTDHVRVPDQHHEDTAAAPAADDGARGLQVDDELGYRPAGTTGCAGASGGGHLCTEGVDQQAADRVAVERVHQRPPPYPDLSPKRTLCAAPVEMAAWV